MYRFVRVLNHNAVIATDSENREVILMGKGIGFRYGKNENEQLIAGEEVEKTYIPLSNQQTQEYLDLFNTMDEDVLSACSEIVLKATESLGDLHPSVFIVLSVHIDFAVKRIKQNFVIENPLLEEIEILYPTEYAVALEGKKILENRLNMSIAPEEAGYIALHLHAARDSRNVKDTLRRINLLRNMSDTAQQLLKISMKKGLIYRQMLNHFRGVMERSEQDIRTSNPLLKEIRLNCRQEFEAAKKIAMILEEGIGKTVSDSEIGYIAVHLNRIKTTVL